MFSNLHEWIIIDKRQEIYKRLSQSDDTNFHHSFKCAFNKINRDRKLIKSQFESKTKKKLWNLCGNRTFQCSVGLLSVLKPEALSGFFLIETN